MVYLVGKKSQGAHVGEDICSKDMEKCAGTLNIYTTAVAKLSIATGHAMQIYNCLGQLRRL